MAIRFSRRRVLLSGLGAALAALVPRGLRAERRRPRRAPAVRVASTAPALAGSSNAHPHATERAMALLTEGADTLDAVVAGVNLVEDDPEEHGVGLGGLPNEDGVVELDASVMHGPTHEAGAVASLQGIRNPASVALKVCWETDHVLLVGEGARRFALHHGFPEENLLTDAARRRWLAWKARLSDRDDWLEPSVKRPAESSSKAGERKLGTIHLSACNVRGEVSGVTSTSGLSWKIPGRVGDSPIIGAGLYVHGKVGSAGSTGRGEAVIIAGGAQAVVEALAQGAHPTDACLQAAQRVVDMNAQKPYLLTPEGRPSFQVSFYAVDVKGRVGAASIYPTRFAACDSQGSRLLDQAHLMRRS